MLTPSIYPLESVKTQIKKGTCITHPILQTPQSPQKVFLSVFLMLAVKKLDAESRLRLSRNANKKQAGAHGRGQRLKDAG